MVFLQLKEMEFKEFATKRNFFGYGDYLFRLLHFTQNKGFSIVEIPAYYKNRIDGLSKSKFFLMFSSYFLSAISN